MPRRLPRFRVGEAQAERMLKMHREEDVPLPEMVRLGFLLSDVKVDKRVGGIIENDHIWFVLENTHDTPTVQFKVNGEHVREILLGVGAAPVALWHSHVDREEPSALDIAQFPRWLVDVGIVYCIDRNTIVHYDHNGVIPAVTTSTGDLFASSDI